MSTNIDLENKEFELLQDEKEIMYFDGVTLRDLDNNIVEREVKEIREYKLDNKYRNHKIDKFMMNKMLYTMSTINSDKVTNSKMCNLVYQLPFLSGANNPGRFATSHLMTFLMLVKNKDYFKHYDRDNMFIDEKGGIIENYCGGDRFLERKGSAIIALFFIDVLRNSNVKENNPYLNDYKYYNDRQILINLINSYKCSEIDSMFDFNLSLANDTVLEI